MAKKKKDKFKIHPKVASCYFSGMLDNGAQFAEWTQLKDFSQEDLEAYKRGLPKQNKWFVMGPAPSPLKRDNKQEEELPTKPEDKKPEDK